MIQVCSPPFKCIHVNIHDSFIKIINKRKNYISFFFFKDWLIDWLLCWVFVSVLGLSLVVASGPGPLFITVRGSLTIVASLVAEHRLQMRWLMGLVAPRHVGSSRTRARTRVPCISRQILNHCATRAARIIYLSSIHFVDNILGKIWGKW